MLCWRRLTGLAQADAASRRWGNALPFLLNTVYFLSDLFSHIEKRPVRALTCPALGARRFGHIKSIAVCERTGKENYSETETKELDRVFHLISTVGYRATAPVRHGKGLQQGESSRAPRSQVELGNALASEA